MHYLGTTISRRTMLGGGMAVASAALGLGGCSATETPSMSAPASDGVSHVPTTSSVSTPPATTPGSVVVEEHGFTSAGNRIFGKLRRPAGDGEHPVVIFSHGFGGNHEQKLHLQELLAQHGVAVYSFDFAGGSGYGLGRSEGNMTDMSVLTEVQNLQDALTFVKSLEGVDPTRITLIGASQGGTVTTLVAEQNPVGVEHIVLFYPAFSLFDDARQRFTTASDIPETVDFMGLTVGRRYYADMLDMDIYDHMAGYHGTVTIFHGTDDNLVPLSYSQRAVTTFSHATLTPLDGEGHGFSTAAQETVAFAILPTIMS